MAKTEASASSTEFGSKLRQLNNVFSQAQNADQVFDTGQYGSVIKFSHLTFKDARPVDQNLVMSYLENVNTVTKLPSSDYLKDLVKLYVEGKVPLNESDPTSLAIGQAIEAVRDGWTTENSKKWGFSFSRLEREF